MKMKETEKSAISMRWKERESEKGWEGEKTLEWWGVALQWCQRLSDLNWNHRRKDYQLPPPLTALRTAKWKEPSQVDAT